MSSILNDTKKTLGIDSTYTAFDTDIIMHINSVFSTLNSIGLGPAEGFEITDDTADWADFLAGDARLNSVKTYLYLRVRLYFDPPATSFVIAALEKQIQEIEWRLNVQREEGAWIDPFPPVVLVDQDIIFDGGVI